jgi:hypothetical protein
VNSDSVSISPYLTMREVADACEWTVRYTRRFLIRAGVAEKLGGDWYVADYRLRDELQAIYARVYEAKAFKGGPRSERFEATKHGRP